MNASRCGEEGTDCKALATVSDKIAGFDAGADDYVVKPYDTRQVMARIRLLVRLKRVQHPRE